MGGRSYRDKPLADIQAMIKAEPVNVGEPGGNSDRRYVGDIQKYAVAACFSHFK